MSKLNNKGFTAIELLATFVILAFVVTGMFDVVLNYKDKEQRESIKSSIIDYENKLEKTIQDDFIKGHLVEVNIDNNVSDNIKTATFVMDKPEYRKKDIENYNESLKSYTTTLTINFSTGVVSYGITGKEIDYPAFQFGTNDKVTINKSKTLIEIFNTENSFVNIKIAFNYTDIDENDILFSMSSPIDYPLDFSQNLLTGTVTIDDINTWDVTGNGNYVYSISDNDSYLKVKIKNTSDINLYYSLYYINDLDIEGTKKPGYITEDYSTLDFNKGVFIKTGEEITFYLNLCGLKDQPITLGLTISSSSITNTKTGICFFEQITNLAGIIKFKAYIADLINKDENTTFIAGNVTDNYVWYSGHLWRAVSIDSSNDTLKLITDQAETFINYGPYSPESGVPYSDSNISKFLRKFLGELRNTTSYVSTSIYNYSSYTSETNSLENTTAKSQVSSNIGLLNAYEYLKTFKDGKSYLVKTYLNWYTASPRTGMNNSIYEAVSLGTLTTADVLTYGISGIRPVISLKSSTVIKSGDGTATNPYMIENSSDITSIYTLASGDYISIESAQTTFDFRVVSKTNNRLKVISTTYAKNGLKHDLSNGSELREYLNTTFLNYFPTAIKQAITTSVWDITPMPRMNTEIDSNRNQMSTKVGLLKVGDLLSGYCDKPQGCMLLTQTALSGHNIDTYVINIAGTRMSTTSVSSSTYYAVPVTTFNSSYLQVKDSNYGTKNNPIVLKIRN